MNNTAVVGVNKYGGLYEVRRARTKSQWINIIIMYERIVFEDGSCIARRFAKICKISRQSTRKALLYYDIGVIVPPIMPQEDGQTGVGSLCRLKMSHHAFIYELYVNNPVLPLHGYIEEILAKCNIFLHINLIER